MALPRMWCATWAWPVHTWGIWSLHLPLFSRRLRSSTRALTRRQPRVLPLSHAPMAQARIQRHSISSFHHHGWWGLRGPRRTVSTLVAKSLIVFSSTRWVGSLYGRLPTQRWLPLGADLDWPCQHLLALHLGGLQPGQPAREVANPAEVVDPVEWVVAADAPVAG